MPKALWIEYCKKKSITFNLSPINRNEESYKILKITQYLS